MKIFILEDDVVHKRRLLQAVDHLALKNNFMIEDVFATDNPDLILKEIANSATHHLYFLDLEINKKPRKGLEIAQEIRKIDPYGNIAFVTSHTELAPVTFAYKVSALDFIVKDRSQEDYEKQVETCLKIAADYEQSKVGHVDLFVFENRCTTYQVPFSEIYYFSSGESAHKIKLKTATKIVEFSASLNEILKIDPRLFRCHNSFVVNLTNVVEIDKSEKKVIFADGSFCFVSRLKMRELERRLKEKDTN